MAIKNAKDATDKMRVLSNIYRRRREAKAAQPSNSPANPKQKPAPTKSA